LAYEAVITVFLLHMHNKQVMFVQTDMFIADHLKQTCS